MNQKLFFKGYIVISSIYLILVLFGLENTAWFLKPVLLPFLILGVYCAPHFTTKRLLLVGLILSWLGDILLLFEEVKDIYFILGLLSFLVAHISYTLVFKKQKENLNHKKELLYGIGLTIIVVYLITLLTLLFPTLADLKIPVIIYSIVISVMLLFAFKGYFVWKSPENKIILVGAIIFVASDSILAIDKFYEPVEKATFWIMSTYLIAQYLISTSIVDLNKKK
ncbi:lysoplasmalogenase [Flavobacterium sp. TMP13]|uniref:lysoplasmalogenase n=1 Tax=Flavobacterium sp. TMP13 TaxID=3425950 RepID=UPI003D77B10B